MDENALVKPILQLCDRISVFTNIPTFSDDDEENDSNKIDIENVLKKTTEKYLGSRKKNKDFKMETRIPCKDTKCEITFKRKRYMKEHYKREHTEIESYYKCNSCGKLFYHKASYYRHVKKCD